MMFRKELIFSTVVIAFIFTTGGCFGEKETYYPLEEGIIWTYLFTNVNSRDNNQEKIIITNLEKKYFKGKKGVPQQITKDGRTGIKFVAENKHGVFMFAEKEFDRDAPVMKKTPAYYFKSPIAIGATWEEKYETQFLMEKETIQMNVTIQSLGETVIVPAGTFRECMKIKKTGSCQKDNGPFFGVSSAEVEETVWYAPKVGLVKSELNERSNHKLAGNGQRITELVSFSSKPQSESSHWLR